MQLAEKRSDIWKLLFFISLLAGSLILTFKTHENKGFYNWQSELWADRAGYYIYLPSLFMYHFDAKKCPEKLDEKLGYGFTIDHEKNTINTKYTYGVAALFSPFFVAARVISPILQKPGDAGFGAVYHKMVNIAAVIYLILGLLLLKGFLSYYFKSGIQYTILFFIYIGTNLLFYATDDTMMSHVYSFFLFSLFLFCMKKVLEKNGHFRYFIILSVASSMIVLIRPTNILFLLLFFLWDTGSLNEIKERIRMVLQPKYIFTFLLILFIVFLPQLIYWKYSRGSFLVYSYGGESFSNWKHPKLLEVWFSTLNGLFLYTPLVIMIIAGMIVMIVKKNPNGWITLILFFLISYLFASWYNWYFGCSFGQRSYVEYFTIFSIPFGYLIKESGRIRNLLLKILPFFLIIIFSYYNIRMMLKFDKCFFGSSWDWPQFNRQLDRAGLFKSYHKDYSFRNDFENVALSYMFTTSDTVHHSGMYSAKIGRDKEFSSCFSMPLRDLGERLPHFIQLGFWIYSVEPEKNEALAVCSIDKNDTAVAWQSQPLAPFIKEKGKWQEVMHKFVLPDGLTREPVIKIYLWNPKKSSFFMDDLSVEFY